MPDVSTTILDFNGAAFLAEAIDNTFEQEEAPVGVIFVFSGFVPLGRLQLFKLTFIFTTDLLTNV